MPDLATLWPFFIAALALNLTPGADMTYVIARTATQGRAAALRPVSAIAGGSVVTYLSSSLRRLGHPGAFRGSLPDGEGSGCGLSALSRLESVDVER